jgi:hypothetical protein
MPTINVLFGLNDTFAQLRIMFPDRRNKIKIELNKGLNKKID